eukprot:1212337-Alexandrium_andersonii.AAC.1
MHSATQHSTAQRNAAQRSTAQRRSVPYSSVIMLSVQQPGRSLGLKPLIPTPQKRLPVRPRARLI